MRTNCTKQHMKLLVYFFLHLHRSFLHLCGFSQETKDALTKNKVQIIFIWVNRGNINACSTVQFDCVNFFSSYIQVKQRQALPAGELKSQKPLVLLFTQTGFTLIKIRAFFVYGRPTYIGSSFLGTDTNHVHSQLLFLLCARR